ncbi:precorrin-6Y C5,15-methyltransferase [Knoellia sinensis KCTC 19936]|uniref:Precorrin-6Y C5,15-methyltransferase n=1 Tax=Knoellia sinensis KCTC 19936 TaxID=1385520 RepID=A0A0A0J5A8_9MICO|nr:precorrin-6Y C5,15-methyltransferase [Knoellia sinensis KCTC 19936]
MSAVIDVVGVPAEGPSALPPVLRDLVSGARTVVGSPRLLDLVPVAAGQTRRPWPSPMLPGLTDFLSEVGTDRVVILATGDPLVSGVGSTLIRTLGPEAVRIHPAVSSVALAHARMGWPSESTSVVSLVSKPVYAVRRHLAPGARVVALSAGAKTPVELARMLDDLGLGDSRLAVLGDLGAVHESRFDCAAAELAHGRAAGPDGIPDLNVVALEVSSDARLVGVTPGLPDEAFEHDGQITKREIRALAMAALRPIAGQRLWDLGAGSGSVSVEWCLAAPRTTAVAVERDPARAERVRRNAASFGVAVAVVTGDSVAEIAQLPTPDAVFIGGGASSELIDGAWQVLEQGGRLVVHCVTLDTEALVVDAHDRLGGELRRVTVERAEPLGRSLSWKPARPIVQWSVTKSPHRAGSAGEETP